LILPKRLREPLRSLWRVCLACYPASRIESGPIYYQSRKLFLHSDDFRQIPLQSVSAATLAGRDAKATFGEKRASLCAA
jgi:hypothetical protein